MALLGMWHEDNQVRSTTDRIIVGDWLVSGILTQLYMRYHEIIQLWDLLTRAANHLPGRMILQVQNMMADMDSVFIIYPLVRKDR